MGRVFKLYAGWQCGVHGRSGHGTRSAYHSHHAIKKGSGDPRWDDSMKKAIASTRSLDRPPPAGFPGTVIVRFDVLPVAHDLLQ